MQSMTFERSIAAPVDEVWSIMADVSRYAERFSAIDTAVPLTDGEFGIGTRWRETRTVYGRSTTVDMRVTDVDPPHRYVVEAHVGARATSEYLLTPSNDGQHTVVRVTFQTVGGSPFYRLAEFLTARYIRRCVAQNNNQDLADLERACRISS